MLSLISMKSLSQQLYLYNWINQELIMKKYSIDYPRDQLNSTDTESWITCDQSVGPKAHHSSFDDDQLM